MKKTLLTAFCLLIIGSTVFAQRQKTSIFNGSISGIPGMQPSAPITLTVDNTTGNCSFYSRGNGDAVGPFNWVGQIPAAKVQDLAQPGAVWSGRLTTWTNMTYAGGTMRSADDSGGNAPISGMTEYDGKSANLTLRIPYRLPGRTDIVNIPFTCTLNVTAGQSAEQTLEVPEGDGFGSINDMSDEDYNAYMINLFGENWRTEHPEYIRK